VTKQNHLPVDRKVRPVSARPYVLSHLVGGGGISLSRSTTQSQFWSRFISVTDIVWFSKNVPAKGQPPS